MCVVTEASSASMVYSLCCIEMCVVTEANSAGMVYSLWCIEMCVVTDCWLCIDHVSEYCHMLYAF